MEERAAGGAGWGGRLHWNRTPHRPILLMSSSPGSGTRRKSLLDSDGQQ